MMISSAYSPAKKYPPATKADGARSGLRLKGRRQVVMGSPASEIRQPGGHPASEKNDHDPDEKDHHGNGLAIAQALSDKGLVVKIVTQRRGRSPGPAVGQQNHVLRRSGQDIQ